MTKHTQLIYLLLPAGPTSICFAGIHLHSDVASTIECPADVSVENNSGFAVVLSSPLAAGASIVCTGVYKLTAQDIDNLSHESFVTVEANDQYDYLVEALVTETVTLEQVI